MILHRWHVVLAGTLLVAACAGTPPPGGAAAPPVPPPPVAGSSAGGDTVAVPVDGGAAAPARTRGERQAEIDARLDASLEGFDERLRKEQEQTAQQRDAAGTAADVGLRDDERDGDGGRRDGPDRSGDLRSAGTIATGEREEGGTVAAAGNGAAARALPSGQDDDIIARRLRRAAEEETDPELKEKLWKEYRDYKENTRGGR